MNNISINYRVYIVSLTFWFLNEILHFWIYIYNMLKQNFPNIINTFWTTYLIRWLNNSRMPNNRRFSQFQTSKSISIEDIFAKWLKFLSWTPQNICKLRYATYNWRIGKSACNHGSAPGISCVGVTVTRWAGFCVSNYLNHILKEPD